MNDLPCDDVGALRRGKAGITRRTFLLANGVALAARDLPASGQGGVYLFGRRWTPGRNEVSQSCTVTLQPMRVVVSGLFWSNSDANRFEMPLGADGMGSFLGMQSTVEATTACAGKIGKRLRIPDSSAWIRIDNRMPSVQNILSSSREAIRSVLPAAALGSIERELTWLSLDLSGEKPWWVLFRHATEERAAGAKWMLMKWPAWGEPPRLVRFYFVGPARDKARFGSPREPIAFGWWAGSVDVPPAVQGAGYLCVEASAETVSARWTASCLEKDEADVAIWMPSVRTEDGLPVGLLARDFDVSWSPSEPGLEGGEILGLNGRTEGATLLKSSWTGDASLSRLRAEAGKTGWETTRERTPRAPREIHPALRSTGGAPRKAEYVWLEKVNGTATLDASGVGNPDVRLTLRGMVSCRHPLGAGVTEESGGQPVRLRSAPRTEIALAISAGQGARWVLADRRQIAVDAERTGTVRDATGLVAGEPKYSLETRGEGGLQLIERRAARADRRQVGREMRGFIAGADDPVALTRRGVLLLNDALLTLVMQALGGRAAEGARSPGCSASAVPVAIGAMAREATGKLERVFSREGTLARALGALRDSILNQVGTIRGDAGARLQAVTEAVQALTRSIGNLLETLHGTADGSRECVKERVENLKKKVDLLERAATEAERAAAAELEGVEELAALAQKVVDALSEQEIPTLERLSQVAAPVQDLVRRFKERPPGAKAREAFATLTERWNAAQQSIEGLEGEVRKCAEGGVRQSLEGLLGGITAQSKAFGSVEQMARSVVDGIEDRATASLKTLEDAAGEDLKMLRATVALPLKIAPDSGALWLDPSTSEGERTCVEEVLRPLREGVVTALSPRVAGDGKESSDWGLRLERREGVALLKLGGGKTPKELWAARPGRARSEPEALQSTVAGHPWTDKNWVGLALFGAELYLGKGTIPAKALRTEKLRVPCAFVGGGGSSSGSGVANVWARLEMPTGRDRGGPAQAGSGGDSRGTAGANEPTTAGDEGGRDGRAKFEIVKADGEIRAGGLEKLDVTGQLTILNVLGTSVNEGRGESIELKGGFRKDGSGAIVYELSTERDVRIGLESPLVKALILKKFVWRSGGDRGDGVRIDGKVVLGDAAESGNREGEADFRGLFVRVPPLGSKELPSISLDSLEIPLPEGRPFNVLGLSARPVAIGFGKATERWPNLLWVGGDAGAREDGVFVKARVALGRGGGEDSGLALECVVVPGNGRPFCVGIIGGSGDDVRLELPGVVGVSIGNFWYGPKEDWSCLLAQKVNLLMGGRGLLDYDANLTFAVAHATDPKRDARPIYYLGYDSGTSDEIEIGPLKLQKCVIASGFTANEEAISQYKSAQRLQRNPAPAASPIEPRRGGDAEARADVPAFPEGFTPADEKGSPRLVVGARFGLWDNGGSDYFMRGAFISQGVGGFAVALTGEWMDAALGQREIALNVRTGPDGKIRSFGTEFRPASLANGLIKGLRAGVVALEWGLNGDFLIDVGYPWPRLGADGLERTFSFPAGDWVGRLGFFLQRSAGGATGDSIALSAGLAVGLGKRWEANLGIIKAWAEIGVLGALMGKAEIGRQGLTEFTVNGTLTVYAVGEASLDVWILSARIRISVVAGVGVEVTYTVDETWLRLEASLGVGYSASVKIGSGIFSWRFSVRGKFEIGTSAQLRLA